MNLENAKSLIRNFAMLNSTAVESWAKEFVQTGSISGLTANIVKGRVHVWATPKHGRPWWLADWKWNSRTKSVIRRLKIPVVSETP